MAIDTKGQDAAWWAQQHAQLKAELDALNPKLNVAEAQLKERDAALLRAERDKADLTARIEMASAKNADLTRAADAAARAASDKIASLTQTLGETQRKLSEANGYAESQAREIDRLSAALKRKNEALAPLVKGLADQHAAIAAALEAGA